MTERKTVTRRRNRTEPCFAKVRGERRYCSALETMNCKNCPFYKTNEQMAEEARLCSLRLRNLGQTRAANEEYDAHLSYLQKV